MAVRISPIGRIGMSLDVAASPARAHDAVWMSVKVLLRSSSPPGTLWVPGFVDLACGLSREAVALRRPLWHSSSAAVALKRSARGTKAACAA
jgi:hypothetical protein